MIKEFNIFTADDLTAFDRTVKVAYQTGKVSPFLEENSGWKFSKMYTTFIKDSNRVANAVMQRIFKT